MFNSYFNRDCVPILGEEMTQDILEYRSIEEPDIDLIHKYQNGECRHELSGILGFGESWAPMSKSQIKEKIDKTIKEKRTAIFTIWTRDGKCIGMSDYYSRWDPRTPHFGIVIWPEYRRQGYGTQAVEEMLKRCFEDSIAHSTSGYAEEWNEASLAFMDKLGFTKVGIERRAGIRNGKFYDGIFLDMLKTEYLARYSGGDE